MKVNGEKFFLTPALGLNPKNNPLFNPSCSDKGKEILENPPLNELENSKVVEENLICDAPKKNYRHASQA